MSDNKYIIGYAKLGTSKCKKCKEKIEKTALRIGKVTPNPFSGGDGDDEMKQWFHPNCIFDTFKRARATTKKIEDPDDFTDGWADLKQEDKDSVNKLIDEFLSHAGSKPVPKPKKMVQSTLPGASPAKPPTPKAGPSTSHASPLPRASSFNSDDPVVKKDNSFRQFRQLCADIAEESSYLGKTSLVKNYIEKGHGGDGFKGDLYLLMKLLLPGVVKVVYNLNNKQLVKLFSQIFGTSLDRMLEDLDKGDVAETIREFFEESKGVKPQKKCDLTLQEVDLLLEELSQMTREEDQQRGLAKIAKRCTANDLKMVVRLIKHDLRINAGAKHILEGLDPNAYAAFQASRNLRDVIDRVVESKTEGRPGMKKSLSIRASLMTPVLPMLAEACRSVDQAMKKFSTGFYAEIKYDGERVQLHKRGKEFRYFSRSLKPVLDHKVRHFKEFIPKAFPGGDDLILDAEVLLVDTNTGSPLPFGTLGKHKQAAFQDATVCLFVFDCLLINDDNLMDRTFKERRKILEKNMTVVKNRVHLSETKLIKEPKDLQQLMSKVFREGLEGLVLKGVEGVYEPGKRHWLKVKKDYLNEGSMADSADLVVLGAYCGTGNKGGMMSIFLMGVFDPNLGQWCTVSKCGNGFDDKTLERINSELDVVKISKDFSKVPRWLNIKKPVTPDYVVRDPKSSPVWEIIGAEFSKAEIHTADGISIRFPRVKRVREDKSWKEATDLPRLKALFKESKAKADSELTLGGEQGSGSGSDSEGNDSDEAGGSSGPIHKAFKRQKHGESDDASPRKKSKPTCKFGAACYQKNPEHLTNFQHPTKDTSKAPQATSDLPSTFHGCKILLPKTTEKFKELKRYIIAYDGDVLQEFEHGSATHIIVDPSSTQAGKQGGKNKARQVKVDWLWACIKRRKLLDTTDFTA